MEITIERVSGPTSDASALIAELDEVLGALYEPEQRHGLSIEQVFQPNVRFFVAHLGDQAAGCGAVALFDGYAEVKRMYTREAARGRGVGKALLGRIEREARDASKPMLRVQLLMTPAPILMRPVVAANAAIGTIASRTSRLSACHTASKPLLSAYCAYLIPSCKECASCR